MELRDEFITLLEGHLNTYKKGDLIKGTICSFDSNGIYVDIGDKTLAVCYNKEFDEEPKKGDEHQFLIIEKNEQEENFILSQKRVHLAYSWQELKKIKDNNDVIMAQIDSCVKGGLIVDVLGIKGFIPSSHIQIKGAEYKQGDKIEAKILTLEPEKESFILSNKKAYNDLNTDTKESLFSQIEVGQVLKGKVVRIADFGAFIDLGGIDGLLPLSQMSWKWVEHPSDILKLGDKIDVEIITIDKQKERISLSLKSLEQDPWLSAKDNINEDDTVEGKITRLKHFGAFVEILSGVEALLSQNEIEDYENENNKKLQVGDNINVKITKVNFEERRIALSII